MSSQGNADQLLPKNKWSDFGLTMVGFTEYWMLLSQNGSLNQRLMKQFNPDGISNTVAG